MSNINDFIIEDGILTGYNGNDTDVVIPDGVTKIEGYAFSYNESLKSVVIPNSVTCIGFSSFDGCVSLETVTIGNSLTTVSDNAFYECKSLKNITLPSSLTAIGSMAFYGCLSLKNVFFNNTEDWEIYYQGFDESTGDDDGDGMEMYFDKICNPSSDDLSDSVKAAEYIKKYCVNYYWCCRDSSYLEYMKSFQ